MAIRVVSFCFYFAARHVPWRQEDWDAYKFIQSVAGSGQCGGPQQLSYYARQ